MQTLRPFVCGTDFSPGAEQALQLAIKFAIAARTRAAAEMSKRQQAIDPRAMTAVLGALTVPGFFVGQAMARTGGKGNPVLLRSIAERLLQS